MRFQNSVRNSIVAFMGQFINVFCGFAVRTVFIHQLGQEFLGVNGVMESMLTLLSMTELGIGTSVAFALYKPVNDDDKPRIGTLMAFYRRTYHILGVLTLVIGLLLIPFMKFFTKDAAQVDHINIIYLLFLGNTVLSYFFAYKRTLIGAYQNHYIISLNENGFALVKYILQIVVLLHYKSYIGYLIINVVCVCCSNIVISILCDRKYGFIKRYRKETLSKEDRALMKKSVISLMYQKIGASLVTGTDNLMITYVSIVVMGIYSNYSMIVSTISRIVYNVLQSIMGSVGNLMVQKDNDYKYGVFEELVFANFCLYFTISVGLAGTLERFLYIFAGEGWILSPAVTFVVILNFFLMGMRQPNVLVIEAAGLFNKLRAKAVLEVVVNLVVSLLFLVVLKMGIYGVLFGTTVSMVSVCIWWESAAVHKYAFEKKLGRYARKYIKYLLVAAAAAFCARLLSNAISLDGIGGFLVTGMGSVALAGIFILVFYGRSMELKHLLQRVIKRHR